MSEVFFIDLILLLLVVITAAAVVTLRSLFAAIMLLGLYSLLMALVWVNMFAMDVAFTEAAVGAGISTFILIGAIVFTGRDEKPTRGLHWPALLAVILTGGALVYGTLDMPRFGDRDAPIHRHVAKKYISQSVGKVGHPPGDVAPRTDFGSHVPNLVTGVLVSYRSLDTLFETAVIFTAGISVVLLLRRRRPRREELL